MISLRKGSFTPGLIFLLLMSTVNTEWANATDATQEPLSQGVTGVWPTEEVLLEEGAPFALRIDLAGALDLNQTDGRFIRIFDAETDQQVFAVDPETGHASEGTESLELPVDITRLVAGNQYYVTADPVFSRLEQEPWSTGSIPEGAWTFSVSADSVIPEPREPHPVLPATPVDGINGVLPFGDINISGKDEVVFQIESVYDFHFEYTEGNHIRVVNAETGEEIYSVDPEEGYPLDVPTRLMFSVPANLFETGETYHVVADHLFARIHGEPWNISEIPASAWPITIQSGSIADQTIAELRDYLESDVPPISDEEFAETDFYKQQMDPMTKRRLDRAHSLALSAVDPDPQWQSTRIESQIINGEPGAQYALTVEKLDGDENVIGPVSSLDMEVVVRIQRGDGSFEYVLGFQVQEYATLSQGELYITVPQDLAKGRLLVGLRPDLDDPGQKVLAERWSTQVTVEIWSTRPGVVQVDHANVVFPVDKDDPFGDELAFTQEQIRDAVEEELESDVFVLPLIVKGMELAQGELVDYRLGTEPYGGRVRRVIASDDQQLLLLIPEWFDVYDITPAEEGFMIEQGVAPEFVVYRTGESMPGFDEKYRSDMTHIGPEERADIDSDGGYVEVNRMTSNRLTTQAGGDKFFEFKGCSGSLSGSIVFTPVFSLDPIDIGLLTKLGLNGSKGECGWEATFGTPINALRFAGPAMIAMQKLIGTGIYFFPTGQIKAGLESNGGKLGADLGWTHRKGGVAEPVITLAEELGSDLLGHPIENKATVAGGVGLNAQLTVAGAKGGSLLGKIEEWLEVDAKDISLNANAFITAGVGVTAANAPAVYAGKQSNTAVTLGVEADVGASKTLMKIAEFLSIGGSLKLGVSFSKDILKGGSKFTGRLAHDNGNGDASVYDLAPESKVLGALFPSAAIVGLVAPEDRDSSVFEDSASVIEYNVEECEEQETGLIEAPVIACMGPYCGKTQVYAFCGGKLEATELFALGAFGSGATAESKVTLSYSRFGEESLQIIASDELFDLDPEEFELEYGNEEEGQVIEATAACEEAGARFGTLTVATDDDSLDEQKEVTKQSILICLQPEDEPKDHVWGSPHLTTSDGLAYDYYASGDYILSTIPGAEGYEIQARFLPGYDVAWPQAAAMQVGEDIVEIFSEIFRPGAWPSARLRVQVNGRDLMEPGQYHAALSNRILSLPGGGSIVVHDTLGRFGGTFVDPVSVFVVWPTTDSPYGHVAHIKAFGEFEEQEFSQFTDVPALLDISIERDDEFSGFERGLLGNNDGDPSNDFMRRNGEVLDAASTPMTWTALYALFGADWLVRPQECLFTRGCQEPKFPESPAVLSAGQKAYAEFACEGLEGWYYEACIHDVGLTGEPALVQEYYADTEDLNNLANQVTQPNSETGFYDATFGNRVIDANSSYDALVYTQDVSLEMVSGNGEYLLVAIPPRGATVTFSNGETSMRGNGSIDGSFTIDCRVPDPEWEALGDAWPEQGLVQLWSIDGLSGSPLYMLEQLTLDCDQLEETYGAWFVDYNSRELMGGDSIYNIGTRNGRRHVRLVRGALSELNDTGNAQCLSISSFTFGSCPQDGYEWQDGDFGRDKLAADGELTKAGSGQAGFDFTKLDENGEELDEEVEEWSCVRDNHTGLTWEAKVDDLTSIHAVQHTYTWYNSDPLTNGGDAGDQGVVNGSYSDPYSDSTCGYHEVCNTEDFVERVNQVALCGYSDWRMPSYDELNSLKTFPGYVFDPEYHWSGLVVEGGVGLDPVFFQHEHDYFNGQSAHYPAAFWSRDTSYGATIQQTQGQ